MGSKIQDGGGSIELEIHSENEHHNIECHGPHNLWQQLQGGTTNV
jgi:hypothetical protein